MSQRAGEVPALPFQRMLLERLPQTRLIMMAPQLHRARKPIELGALHETLERLVAHRASLRAAVFERDGRWLQRATNEGPRIVPLDVPSGLMSEVLPAWRAAVAVLDASQGVNLAAFPIRSARGCHRFGLLVSHMALDGISSRDLEYSVGAIYARLIRGEPPVLFRESMSALDYASRLAEALAAGAWEGERAHWTQTVRAARETPGFGPARDADRSKRMYLATLDEATWTRVRALATAGGVAVTDAAWGVVVGAIQAELELDGLLVHVFAHARRNVLPGLDVMRMFGAAASTLPLFVPRLPVAPFARIAAMSKALRDARDRVGDGVGYWMLRDGDESLALVDGKEPGRNGVALNWLGPEPPDRKPFLIDYLSPHDLGSTDDRGPLAVAVNEQRGGLRFIWEYLPTVIDPGRIEALWDRCRAAFEQLR